MNQQQETKVTWNDLDEPNKLIITAINEGKCDYVHLEKLIGKSRAIVQQRVDYLVDDLKIVSRVYGPSGRKTLKDGLRLTESGKELFNGR